jgi:proline racemase
MTGLQEPRSTETVPHVRRALTAVDSHTCGQQTRVIVEGLPAIAGSSVRESQERLQTEADWIRRVAALEPRGHRSMFVAAIVPPFDPTCVCGVLFMDPAGYHDMCGHATIGVVTTLVNLGYVTTVEGPNELKLETPAGVISVRAHVHDGRARSVAFVGRPSYVLDRQTLTTEDGAAAEVTFAYGGQWYAFVEAPAFGLSVQPDRIEELVATATVVRSQIALMLSRPDPLTGEVPMVGNIVWCDTPTAGADGRNVPVNVAGGFDRSPCGTATCARLAILHEQGSLGVGETFVNQGLLGTLYRGRILEVSTVNGHPAVVPEIEGSAWLTGRLEIWIDDEDPFREGILVL